MTVFARGLLNRLFTRVYLPWTTGPGRGPAARLADAGPPDDPARDAPTRTGYVFDVRLQGERRDRLPQSRSGPMSP